MKLNKSIIITGVLTLGLGLLIGALFLGNSGSTMPGELPGHEGHQLEQMSNGVWTCSMHPQVRQTEAGSCPFCGMDLIPVQEGDDDPTVLKMSNAAMQLANIQTSVIGEGKLNGSIKLNGRVKADERRVHTQTIHFAGRIEKLYKDFVGETVRKGDKIAALYSPDLVSAQEELIAAKKLEKSNPILLEAARKKLRYWKLSNEQIAAIENSDQPMRNVDLLSDFNGTITQKLINTGDHLHEGEGLFQVTDLSKLWVMFEVYERDIAEINLGDKVYFSTRNSNRSIESKVTFISPEVNPRTRIVEVRAEVDNRNQWLKPDMFVNGEIESNSSGMRIMLPESAVLWTGKRSVVYVKTGDERSFQLRRVILGPKTGDFYSVESGLEAGDEVVTNGAFTLDAEAQLKGKISMMNSMDDQLSDHPESEFKEVELPGAKNYKDQVDPEFQNQLMNLSMAYLELKDLMVEGNGGLIRKAGVEVKDALEKIDMTLTKDEAHLHWMKLLRPMETSLKAITTTGDRDVQRLQFINLSKALINAVESYGTSLDSPLYVQFCPMANNDKGATWISMNEEVINPYFGDVMLNCGNVEYIIEGK